MSSARMCVVCVAGCWTWGRQGGAAVAGRWHSARGGCELSDGDDREYTEHIYIIRHNCM